MNSKVVNYRRIERAIEYLVDNFKLQPSLENVAAQIHMSPFHFHRIFLDWVGITPKKFLQYVTLEYLRKKIHETNNITDAAELAGLSTQSRVYDLFVSIESVTPDQYKQAGSGLNIFYGYHPSPFGLCFLATTPRGICGLKFIDEERKQDEFEAFFKQWHFAKLVHKPAATHTYLKKIFNVTNTEQVNVQLLVRGTNFQIKVWEALLKIPFGSVASFQQVAKLIDRPNSARAVANAVAANPILYLIPCHRIICKDGSVGVYHKGRVRKQAMIGWEIAKKAGQQETG